MSICNRGFSSLKWIAPALGGAMLVLSACSSDNQSTYVPPPPQDYGPNAQPGPPKPLPPERSIGLMDSGVVRSAPSNYSEPGVPSTQGE